MDIIEKSMEIIANAGEGRSLAMMAVHYARLNQIAEAEESLAKAKSSITKGHQAHSELLFHDAQEQDLTVSLLMVHAADHLTGAEIMGEMAEEFIFLYKELRTR